MDPAVLTLAALALAVLLSCVTELNIGLLAIALACMIGVYHGGMPEVKKVAGGFPSELFLILAGVTLLFSLARVNGTLERVTHAAVKLCRGRVGLVPIIYFVLAAVVASAGPGNIATTGLLAPMAMATALRMRIPLFLMAIMVGNGANSGSLSRFAPTGLIVNRLMIGIQLPGLETQTWLYNFAAHAIVAFSAYLLFGGWKLLTRSDRVEGTHEQTPIERKHWLTLAVIGLFIGAALAGMHIGMAAFLGVVALILLRASDQDEAIRKMPWGTIVMVCGVTVLISLVQDKQGIALLTDLLAKVVTRASVVPVLGGMVGLISAYSSTSGVVLPAFLPMVPNLSANLGGGLSESLAMTMNVSGHLVDVSPLSTIGALCLASIPPGPENRKLFNQLLAWGLSMTVVGALLCWLFFAVK